MRYKFPQFPDLVFEDPTFYLGRVNDHILTSTCQVELCCDYKGNTYSFDLDDFIYQDTWSDDEAMNFAIEQIQKYKA